MARGTVPAGVCTRGDGDMASRVAHYHDIAKEVCAVYTEDDLWPWGGGQIFSILIIYVYEFYIHSVRLSSYAKERHHPNSNGWCVPLTLPPLLIHICMSSFLENICKPFIARE